MFCHVALVRTDDSKELSDRRVRRLLLTANVLNSPILVTLMKEALSFSETSVLTRATRQNIPVDTILQLRLRFGTVPFIDIPTQFLVRKTLPASGIRAKDRHTGNISVWYEYRSLTCNILDRLCGLVVRVPGYRSTGPGFDFRRYQILWDVVGLERSPLSLVRIVEELHEKRIAAPV
jgi:hypothetical protein